ncbi:hypothetical protein HFN89_06065 [Rhizobium laguerreae]|nr:hypothetical protein [Rhizobium laguerreae]
MKFVFKYPALVRGLPPRCKSERTSEVWLDGWVDVPEFSARDIPIACRFLTEDRDKSHDYRFHDGRLYRRRCQIEDVLGPELWNGRQARPFAVATGIFYEMERVLLERWQSLDRKNRKPMWPSITRISFDDIGRRFHGGYYEGHPDFNSKWWDGRPSLGDIGSMNEEDVAYCESKAKELAQNVVIIDGAFWSVTSEPLLFLSHGSYGHPLCHIDRDFLAACAVNAESQPAPFGSAERVHDSSAYWRWNAQSYSILDHHVVTETLVDWKESGRISKYTQLPDAEVHILDAFGPGPIEQDLIRIARAVCVHVHEEEKERRIGPGLSRIGHDTLKTISHHCEQLESLAVGTPSEVERDRIADTLMQLAESAALRMLLSAPRPAAPRRPSPWGRTVENMPERLVQFLRDYENRPLEMARIQTTDRGGPRR